MHDPKFESAVQEKMEQLEFIPSDSVWANIEMAVTQRRRRAVPVFIWFLLAGLLLAGAGTVLYLRKDNQTVAKNTSVPAGAAAAKNGNVTAKNTTSTPGAPEPASGTPAVADPSVAGTQASARPADAGLSTSNGNQSTSNGNHWTTASHHYGTGLMARANSMNAGTKMTHPADQTRPADPTHPADEIDAESPANAPFGSSANPATTATRQHFAYRPGLIGSFASKSGIKGPRLPSSATKTAVTGIPRPKRPWSLGFAGGLGVSSYNESLMGKSAALTYGANVPATSAAQYLPAAVTSNSNNTSSKRVTSTVQPGLSYWAGIAAQKPLSARWTLSLGLDLHYYSSSLRVGGVVTTYARSSSALIGNSAFSAMQSYPYYSVGDMQVFTNRYYYLELPVAMQWRINRGRVVPLFLRGGVTLSRLMSSNGLYYDDESAVYYKDNAVIQPMQVSFTSGLIAALPLKGIRIQAGPEMQYGATTLLKGGAGNGHLLYGGLRVTVMR
jgi:hypothetical protein